LRPRRSVSELSSGFSKHLKLVVTKLESFKGLRLERQRRKFALLGEPNIFNCKYTAMNETIHGV